MISVVVPLYNKNEYIYDTLMCVINQSFEDFEIIVVDDGSTDNSVEIVNNIKDNRIKLFLKNNGGVSSARNYGVEKAEYEYIAFLDADDFWKPNHLEVMYNLISVFGNEAGVFVTNFARKYPNGTIVSNRNDLSIGILGNYFHSVLKGAVVHTSCVCVRKKVFKEVNGFDERMSRGEDLDLWIRLAAQFKIAYSNVVTEIYTIDAVNNSGRKMAINKSVVFYLDFKEVKSFSQFRYFVKMVFYKSLSVLLKDRSIKGFFLLYYQVIKNTIFNKKEYEK